MRRLHVCALPNFQSELSDEKSRLRATDLVPTVLAFCQQGGRRSATWDERTRHQPPQNFFFLKRLHPRPGTRVKLARTVQCASSRRAHGSEDDARSGFWPK